MQGITGTFSFTIDFWGLSAAIFLALIAYFSKYYKKLFSDPYLSFSSLKLLNQSQVDKGRLTWHQRLPWLEGAAIGLLLLALFNPRFFALIEDRESESRLTPTKGIAIYLLIDQSGSMRESVDALMADGSIKLIPKIDLAKEVTHDFILGNPAERLAGRPNDLIGLLSLARTAHILVPLTLDHQAVDEALQKVQVVTKQDDDGTAIGYAIYKTVNLIAATRQYAQELSTKGKPAYEIKNSVIIVVTDGLQAPSPLDKGKRLRNIELPEAAALAKKEGVKLYIINVDPSIASSSLSPQRNQMQKITEETGGKFYMAFGNQRLADVYQEINRIEKSTLPISDLELAQGNLPKEDLPQFYRKIPLYPYLLILSGFLILSVLFLKNLYVRKVP